MKREFEEYGPVKKVRIVHDTKSGKPRGYAFIEFDKERDMRSMFTHHYSFSLSIVVPLAPLLNFSSSSFSISKSFISAAYKLADGKKVDGRRVLVDVERGRTVKGWKPRRLGGGLGSTRAGGEDVNQKWSGRYDSLLLLLLFLTPPATLSIPSCFYLLALVTLLLFNTESHPQRVRFHDWKEKGKETGEINAWTVVGVSNVETGAWMIEEVRGREIGVTGETVRGNETGAIAMDTGRETEEQNATVEEQEEEEEEEATGTRNVSVTEETENVVIARGEFGLLCYRYAVSTLLHPSLSLSFVSFSFLPLLPSLRSLFSPLCQSW